MISFADADASFAAATLPARMERRWTRGWRGWWPLAASDVYRRYQDLQAYVGWTEDDAAQVRQFADHIRRNLDPLIDDFYAEIQRHPDASRVITGGATQIERLKTSLRHWLSESFECRSDADYVTRRWKIGLRHAEIGLNPAYTSAALARLRNGILAIVARAYPDSSATACRLAESINKLLDLDLAVIQDAYQAEYL
jgi:hypothetical protein